MKRLLLLTGTLLCCSSVFAQSIKQHCTYTDSSGQSVLDMSKDGYVLMASGKELKIAYVDQNCHGTPLYSETFTENIIGAAINSKGADVTIAIMTDHQLKLQSLKKTGSSLTVIKAGESNVTNDIYVGLKVGKADWGMSVLAKHYNQGTSVNTHKIGFITTNDVGFGSPKDPSCNCYAGIVSDDTAHYLLYTDPAGVYIEKRKHDASLSYRDRYFVINTAGAVVTDYVKQDTTITIMATDKSNGKSIRQIVDRTSPVLVGFYAPYSFTSGTSNAAPIYINRSVTAYGNIAITHGDNLSGPVNMIDDVYFAANSPDRFQATSVRDNYFLWSAIENTGPLVVWLVNTAPGLDDSVVINDGPGIERINGFYQNSHYTMFGSGNNKAKVWILNVSVPTTEVEAIYRPSAGTNETIVYPNPTSDVFTVQTPSPIVAGAIIDMTGYPVRQIPGNGTTEQHMTLYRLASGAYILKLKLADGSTVNRKIIKQ